jgi:hypothetical protein
MLNNLFQLHDVRVITRSLLLGIAKTISLEVESPLDFLATGGQFFNADVLKSLLQHLDVDMSIFSLYSEVIPDVRTNEILTQLPLLVGSYNVICVNWSQNGPKHYSCFTQVDGNFYYCDSLKAAPLHVPEDKVLSEIKSLRNAGWYLGVVQVVSQDLLLRNLDKLETFVFGTALSSEAKLEVGSFPDLPRPVFMSAPQPQPLLSSLALVPSMCLPWVAADQWLVSSWRFQEKFVSLNYRPTVAHTACFS